MSGFPMIVEFQDRDVVLIGAGKEGLFKVRTLLKFGANVTLIAPAIEPELQELVDNNPGRLFYVEEAFRPEMIVPEELQGPEHEEERNEALENLAAVVAATDDREVNEEVSRICHRYRIPVNIVDQTHLSTFFFPSILKEDEVVCAVSSGGKSPLVTQIIRDRIRDILPDHIGEINERMGELRPKVAKIHDRETRKSVFRKALAMFMAAQYPDDITDEMLDAVIKAAATKTEES